MSNINKSGKLPDTEAATEANEDIGCSPVAVIAGIVVVGLALLIGAQAVGVLYALAAPPDAPLPADVRQLSSQQETHGVDSAVYSTRRPACEIVAFYREAGGQCTLEPGWCGAGDANTAEKYADPVAQCAGRTDFSIFEMRWQAVISAGYYGEEPTQFELSRTVFWTGAPEEDR